MNLDKYFDLYGPIVFFAVGIYLVVLRFYDHYEKEIDYLRAKIDKLEGIIAEMRETGFKPGENKS